MFDKLKSLFKKPEPVVEKPPVEKKPRKPRKPREEKVVSEKERATAAGEPYVAILKVDVDPGNINSGSFDLDWNDKFLLNLIKAGYKQRPDDTDNIIVDRWFQTVCRNVALEVYEQQQADPLNREDDDLRRINRKDLGNGRSEIS
jgi:hypothetical protein